VGVGYVRVFGKAGGETLQIRGRKTFPCLCASREEEDAQCSSKQASFLYIYE